ncbi:MAG: hypothetical protein ACJZ69_04765 [Pelagibacteraceae bacterium]
MSNEQLEKGFQEKISYFLRKNLKKIIIFVVIIVFISLSIIFFDIKNSKENEKLSENYNTAQILIQKNNKEEANSILLSIINKKNKVYSPLSLYLILDLNLISNKNEIDSLFDKIISIKDLDEEEINLIKIKKALFLMDYEDEQKILEILNPIINKNSVWKNTALELLANFFLSKGDKLKSEEYFKLIELE